MSLFLQVGCFRLVDIL